MAKQVNSCRKCRKCSKTVRNGIFCKGRCQKWYHCGCGGLSEGKLCQLGCLDEEWRCEKCAKEFEEDLKRLEEAGSNWRADEMVSKNRQKFGEGERVIENFHSQRGVFTGEEVEAAIKERYREARSEREVTDTNVSNLVQSIKEEVMTQLGQRKCKDIFIVEQLLIELPPQMVELLLHQMKWIEVLERDVEG